jgi:hypothetical protein
MFNFLLIFAGMDEQFLIPVLYNGIERQFEASLRMRGYSHRFEVNVDGIIVYFERDEEGNYRAVIPPEEKGKVPPIELLQAIGQAIEGILK